MLTNRLERPTASQQNSLDLYVPVKPEQATHLKFVQVNKYRYISKLRDSEVVRAPFSVLLSADDRLQAYSFLVSYRNDRLYFCASKVISCRQIFQCEQSSCYNPILPSGLGNITL